MSDTPNPPTSEEVMAALIERDLQRCRIDQKYLLCLLRLHWENVADITRRRYYQEPTLDLIDALRGAALKRTYRDNLPDWTKS